MWRIFVNSLLLVSVIEADMSPNYFCADMNPQVHINIEQLMGMWYGIEILNHHTEEHHYIRIEPSCPILHISEDKSHDDNYPYGGPLHREYEYNYNYGERRDPNNYNNQQQQQRTYGGRNYDNYQRTTPQYVRGRVQTQHPYYDKRYPGQINNNNRRPYGEEMKKLRIWWDQNGSGTEYHLRYNITRPGFWLSSGPQNGSELEPQYSHFAGTVQVIKAVGNHLVLTFCHQLPDRRLFSVILSRENKLDRSDISGVHSLLLRRGLSTSAVKKVCNNGTNKFKLNYNIAFLSIFMLISLKLFLDNGL